MLTAVVLYAFWTLLGFILFWIIGAIISYGILKNIWLKWRSPWTWVDEKEAWQVAILFSWLGVFCEYLEWRVDNSRFRLTFFAPKEKES